MFFRSLITIITVYSVTTNSNGRAIQPADAEAYLPTLMGSFIVEASLEAPENLLLPSPSPHTSSQASAAGVLPISIDPKTGEVVLLFGLEYRSWDERPKVVITDFGGKVDPGETKLIAAAREFTEETASVYPTYKEPPSSSSTEKGDLTPRGHNLIELKTASSYAAYLLPMPYKNIEEIQEKADIMRKVPGNHVEKDAYYWVKLSDYLRKKSKLSVSYKGPNRSVSIYKGSKVGVVTEELNSQSKIPLFHRYHKYILSDPGVQEYLQQILDLNAEGSSSTH